MKRRLISLVLVMILCLSLTGNAFALSSGGTVVQPRSSISVTCGLYKSGSQYRVWSKTQYTFTDDLTARVSLYKVMNGSEYFITSASAGTTGTSVTASNTRSLSSGTYKVYGYGRCSTSSSSDTYTITIP